MFLHPYILGKRFGRRYVFWRKLPFWIHLRLVGFDRFGPVLGHYVSIRWLITNFRTFEPLVCSNNIHIRSSFRCYVFQDKLSQSTNNPSTGILSNCRSTCRVTCFLPRPRSSLVNLSIGIFKASAKWIGKRNDRSFDNILNPILFSA